MGKEVPWSRGQYKMMNEMGYSGDSTIKGLCIGWNA